MSRTLPPLRIALIQSRNARDIRNWSGTPYFSKAALERHVGDVVDLSPPPIRYFPLELLRKVVRAISGKVYSYDHEPALARYFGWYFSRKLKREQPDLIYAPAGSACVAFLRTQVPIIYYSDATWRLVQDYLPFFSNVTRRTARGGEELEKRTLSRSAVMLFSSRWAADSAVEDYGADPARVHDVLIGANLLQPPNRSDVLPRTLGKRVRLLFIGTRWDLKGGQIAVDTLLRLLELGADATLTVAGCHPPRELAHPRVMSLGYLDKQIPEQRARFERLWFDADFFLLPTRSEAAGIVFCEAAAHALPVLTTNTGGVPSLVLSGENGYTLPLEAGADDYARTIVEMMADPKGYERLCVSSRNAYEERLNWDSWGERVAEIVAQAFPMMEERLRSRRATVFGRP